MSLVKTIVIINDFAYINGGAGQVALTSAIGLARNGYQVILIAAVGPVMPELLLAGVRVELTDQYEIANDPNRLRAIRQGLWNFSSQELTIKLLSELNTASTIVHIHSWTKALSSSIVRVTIRCGFKVICTLHDYFIACPNGGFFDYQDQTICRKLPLSLDCISKNCDVRSYPQKIWRVIRHNIQNSIGFIPNGINNFISISDFSYSVLKPFLPSQSKIFRIINPIDIEKDEKVNVSSNRIVIFVGRLSPEKGVLLLAAAANRLNLSPVFVGDGEARDSILAACPNARITGWVSKNEVKEHLKSARVLVLPSLWYETQGLVVAEAAAMGVPSIVPDSCAAREMVSDGETGLWFRGGQVDDLVNKIYSMLNDYYCTELGTNAYVSYWNNSNSLANHIYSLENCYENILSNE